MIVCCAMDRNKPDYNICKKEAEVEIIWSDQRPPLYYCSSCAKRILGRGREYRLPIPPARWLDGRTDPIIEPELPTVLAENPDILKDIQDE